jgi:hypothetical protein
VWEQKGCSVTMAEKAKKGIENENEIKKKEIY